MVRFFAIIVRIDVRVTARQQYAVETAHCLSQIIGLWNKCQMNRNAAKRFYGLAIVAAEVKPVGFDLQPHRNSNAWSMHHKPFNVLSISLFSQFEHLNLKSYDLVFMRRSNSVPIRSTTVLLVQ